MTLRGRCAVLLTLLALACSASLLAAAAPAKTRPRLSREQATQQAAAFARALDVPLDRAAVARFSGPTSTFSGSTWTLGIRFSRVVIRDDTGQLLELGAQYGKASRPGARPVSREKATASASRVLRIAGMPAEVKLRGLEHNGMEWLFRCGRQTPQGVWYGGGRTLIVIDTAGRVQAVTLDWSPDVPPTSAEMEQVGQAKEKAAAFAKAVGLPWDDSSAATLTYVGDPKKMGPALWGVQCRGTNVIVRGDTGAVLAFDGPGAMQQWTVGEGAMTPSPGKEPPTKEEAVAAASHVLRVLGAAPDAPPKPWKLASGGWHFLWGRRTPDGVPYCSDTTSATVDPAGRVVSASLNWHSRPPASTKPKLSKRRARGLALDAGRQAGRLGTGPYAVTAELEIVRPSDFGKALTAQYDVPTRLVWAVIFTRQDTGGELTICIDAADGKLVGISSGRAVPWDVGVEASRPPRPLSPRVGLALWVGAGALVAAFAAAAAYLARRREERATEEQAG